MEFRLADLDDEAEMTALTELLEAARQVDAPFLHQRSVRVVTAEARYGYDLEPDVAYVGVVAGTMVARGTMYVSGWDNPDLAWLGVVVHPDHRRRGHGTQVLELLQREAVAKGRTLLGLDAWDGSPGVRFAEKHGFDKKSQAVLRRQVLADLSPAVVADLHDAAARHFAAYELVRLRGPLPDDLIVDFCRMAASINDAPLDDLELEDDVVEPKRVRDVEHAMRMQGIELYRVVARHRGSGELAGHSSVAVEQWSPGVAWQLDTTVTPAHRGHRLGLGLKTDMLRWLAEAEPQVRTIDTWNAETNDFMISVNEQLGYRVLARELQYQRRV